MVHKATGVRTIGLFAPATGYSERQSMKDAGIDVLLAKLDVDSSGSVDLPELASGLRQAGIEIQDSAVETLMDKFGVEEGPGRQKTLKITDLHKMLDAVAEHKFYTFEDESVAQYMYFPPPSPPEVPPHPPQRHYVFSCEGHFEGAIEGAFARVDANGDGVLQPSEVKEALADLGVDCDDDKLNNIFTLYDANGDGVLQLGEFADMVDGLDHE